MEALFKSSLHGLFIGVVFIMLVALFMREQDEDKAKFVYVNMDRVIERVTKEVVAIEDGEEAKEAIKDYKQRFVNEIEAYSQQEKKIIFSSPKPIAGANDKTDFFITKILGKKLSKEGNKRVIRSENIVTREER